MPNSVICVTDFLPVVLIISVINKICCSNLIFFKKKGLDCFLTLKDDYENQKFQKLFSDEV